MGKLPAPTEVVSNVTSPVTQSENTTCMVPTCSPKLASGSSPCMNVMPSNANTRASIMSSSISPWANSHDGLPDSSKWAQYSTPVFSPSGSLEIETMTPWFCCSGWPHQPVNPPVTSRAWALIAQSAAAETAAALDSRRGNRGDRYFGLEIFMDSLLGG